MNERIKELALESQLVTSSNGALVTGWLEHVDLTEYLAKFAELIVKECIDQVNSQYRPVMEDNEMRLDPYWDGYVNCGVDSIGAIRQHFENDK